MDRKEFIVLVERFVKDYQKNHVVNDEMRNEILNNSTTWNKGLVVIDLITKIEDHRLYEEEGFPFIAYVDKLLTPFPKPIATSSKTIDEQDFSLDK